MLPPQGKLFDFLQDAHRFLLYNKRAIEIAPLQIYSSALLLSPIKSLIRNAFLHDIPPWITSRPSNEDEWSPCLQTLEGHQDPVTSLIRLDADQIASASVDETIKIWDVNTGTCVKTFGHIEGLYAFTSLTNGRIASGSDKGIIKIWDLATGECTSTMADDGSVVKAMTRLTSERMATGSIDGVIKIWDLNENTCVQRLAGHTGSILALHSLMDNQLISGSSDCTVKIWDLSAGECTRTLEGHIHSVLSVAVSTDGQIASASSDRTVKIWDATTGTCIQTLTGHADVVLSVTFSATGQVASASGDGMIIIWDAATGMRTKTIKGHIFSARSVIFLSEVFLASCSSDMSIKLWDLHSATNVEAQTSGEHTRPVLALAISGDGHIVSGSEDGTIRIWDITTGRCSLVLKGHMGGVAAVDISEDSRLVLSGSRNGHVNVWDAATGMRIKRFDTPSKNGIPWVKFSPDTRYAAAPVGRTVEIWSTATWTSTHTLEGGYMSSETATFSLNGQYIASASYDQKIRIWDTATGACVQTLVNQQRAHSWSLAFSPDTRYIASKQRDDGIIDIWDLSTGACIRSLNIGSGRTGWLSFDSTANFRLYCDLGAFDLDLDAAQVSDVPSAEVSPMVCFHGYGIDGYGEWIVEDGRPILWLPQEHRVRACIIRGSTVIVGCRSGRVLILRFSESGPDL
jgi:WD40 repeat protein